MSIKPDFTTMTTPDLRAYVLAYRNDEEALQAYLDRLHTENPNSRIYKPEDDVTEAIAEYFKDKNQNKVY